MIPDAKATVRKAKTRATTKAKVVKVRVVKLLTLSRMLGLKSTNL